MAETLIDTVYSRVSILRYAPVAQWIEQWFPEPCGGGSSPFRCVLSLFKERKDVRILCGYDIKN